MQGLVTKARKVIDPAAAPFARTPVEIEGLGLREGANLIEVVNLPRSCLVSWYKAVIS